MIPDAEQKVVLELISDGRELYYINGLVHTVSKIGRAHV